MHKFTAFVTLSSIAMVLLCVLEQSQVEALCCHTDANSKCNDGSNGTPCCGKGSCNIFCCNCDGGCWPSKDRRRRDENSIPEETNSTLILSQYDTNNDGHFDHDEAHNYMMSSGCGHKSMTTDELKGHFSQLDKNGDGKLHFEEIDATQ